MLATDMNAAVGSTTPALIDRLIRSSSLWAITVLAYPSLGRCRFGVTKGTRQKLPGGVELAAMMWTIDEHQAHAVMERCAILLADGGFEKSGPWYVFPPRQVERLLANAAEQCEINLQGDKMVRARAGTIVLEIESAMATARKDGRLRSLNRDYRETRVIGTKRVASADGKVIAVASAGTVSNVPHYGAFMNVQRGLLIDAAAPGFSKRLMGTWELG